MVLVQLNSNIMNFLTYLYYKYYRFQVRVGNGDIALFTSIMFIIVCALFYYWSIQSFVYVIFPNIELCNKIYLLIGAIILSCGLLLWCWLRVWRKKRYKEIIKYYEKVSPKSSWRAILVAVFSLLFYGFGFLLMILRNNGII